VETSRIGCCFRCSFRLRTTTATATRATTTTTMTMTTTTTKANRKLQQEDRSNNGDDDARTPALLGSIRGSIRFERHARKHTHTPTYTTPSHRKQWILFLSKCESSIAQTPSPRLGSWIDIETIRSTERHARTHTHTHTHTYSAIALKTMDPFFRPPSSR